MANVPSSMASSGSPGQREYASIASLDPNYTLEREGNVLTINVDTFGYDRQNRLTSASVSDLSNDSHSYLYSYDLMGNRLSSTEDGNVKTYSTADHNLLTQAGDKSYTYDALGNTIAKTGGWEYVYDEENRLVQIKQNGVITATYWYDAGGMRIRTDEGGTVKYYVYNGFNVIQEQDDATGARTDYVFAGSTRVASKAGTEVRYFHGDHLGSTRVITDAAGAVAGEYKYAPFGANLGSGAPPAYGFTGKPEDAGTGLQYFGARYYDPEIGRFITVDPIGDGLNWYEYCRSNPLRFIDPTGLDVGFGQCDELNPSYQQMLIEAGEAADPQGNNPGAFAAAASLAGQFCSAVMFMAGLYSPVRPDQPALRRSLPRSAPGKGPGNRRLGQELLQRRGGSLRHHHRLHRQKKPWPLERRLLRAVQLQMLRTALRPHPRPGNLAPQNSEVRSQETEVEGQTRIRNP